MKRAFVSAVILGFSSLGTTPAFATALGPLTMAVQFSPNPPKQGTETIIVHLSDAQHRPVSGALVSIVTSMPTMSMSGPTVRAVSKGNGTYIASVNLNFATRWTFTTTAHAGGNAVKRVIQQDVK